MDEFDKIEGLFYQLHDIGSPTWKVAQKVAEEDKELKRFKKLASNPTVRSKGEKCADRRVLCV